MLYEMKKTLLFAVMLTVMLPAVSCGNSGKKKEVKADETEIVVEAGNVKECNGCEGCPSPDGCGSSEDPEAVHGTCCGNS